MFEIKKAIDYMDKIKPKTEGKKYYINTFGCQLNENDSEKIAGMLERCGYTRCDDQKDADIIAFNTCCVRENAENTLFGKLGEVKKYAQNGTIIAIGGCMMQEKNAVEKIRTSFPFVNIVFGTHTLQNLPRHLYEIFEGRKRVFDIEDIDGEVYEGLPVKRNNKYQALVTITYGCNNFCTFCIVPYVRGRERSRRWQDIQKEVEDLVADGCIEVTLLGQNVNSFKGDEQVPNFAALLDKIASIPGLKKLRFVSPHPKDFNEDVVKVMQKHENISRILHYPLQSGSDKILKRMNRKYTKEQFLEKANMMKQMLPEISFSTDIIVGFPGETEEDFEDTLDVVRQMDLDQIYMFIYSKRTGTPAAIFEDQIPYDVAQKRLARLKDLFEEKLDAKNETLVGKIEDVIVEGESKKDKNLLYAKNDANKTLILEKYDNWHEGDYIKVKIVENHRYYLKAEKI